MTSQKAHSQTKKVSSKNLPISSRRKEEKETFQINVKDKQTQTRKAPQNIKYLIYNQFSCYCAKSKLNGINYRAKNG